MKGIENFFKVVNVGVVMVFQFYFGSIKFRFMASSVEIAEKWLIKVFPFFSLDSRSLYYLRNYYHIESIYTFKFCVDIIIDDTTCDALATSLERCDREQVDLG